MELAHVLSRVGGIYALHDNFIAIPVKNSVEIRRIGVRDFKILTDIHEHRNHLRRRTAGRCLTEPVSRAVSRDEGPTD